MPKVASGLWASAAVATVMVSFALNSIITRYLVLGSFIDPFPLTIIRFLSGLGVLQLLALTRPGKLGRRKPRLADAVGGLFLGAYAFAISYGYTAISASVGTFVFYTFVVITMGAYSVAKEGERTTPRLIASLLLGIFGVLLISLGPANAVSIPGVAMMAVTGVSWGLYSVHGKRFENYFGYTYFSFLTFGLASAGLALVAYPFDGSVWTGIPIPDLGLALYLGMVSTAPMYVLWNRVLKQLGASQGGLVQLLVPAITALLGVTLLDEKVTTTLVLGGATIGASIYLSSLRQSKRVDAVAEAAS